LPRKPFTKDACPLDDRISKAQIVKRCLHAVQILTLFGHAMDSARPGRQDLEHTFVHLDIKSQNVAAQIGKDIVLDQDLPEACAILCGDLPLALAGKAVDRKDRVMADYELEACVGMAVQRLSQPSCLHMAFTTQL
jgi:hypothetical protein